MLYKKYFSKFIKALDKKMEKGFHEYGDKTFSRNILELLNEIQDELLDTCGWSNALWVKIEKLKEYLKKMIM